MLNLNVNYRPSFPIMAFRVYVKCLLNLTNIISSWLLPILVIHSFQTYAPKCWKYLKIIWNRRLAGIILEKIGSFRARVFTRFPKKKKVGFWGRSRKALFQRLIKTPRSHFHKVTMPSVIVIKAWHPSAQDSHVGSKPCRKNHSNTPLRHHFDALWRLLMSEDFFSSHATHFRCVLHSENSKQISCHLFKGRCFIYLTNVDARSIS